MPSPDSHAHPRFARHATLLALMFAATGIGGVVYGARAWMPELASRHGAGIDSMLTYLLVSVGGLFLVSYLALAYFIWRGGRRTAIGPRFASRRTERALSIALGVGMAIIAEGGVLAIGMPVWAEYFDAAPPADAIVIDVTAQQFMWNVRYPGPDGVFGRTEPRLIDDTTNPIGMDRTDPAGKDDIITLNEITVPFGRAVRIRLHSKDVIHSFFLPNFRVKQDAVPGMTPEVVFFPTKTGHFEIACAELCGLAHYRMRGFFNVVPPADFDTWLHKQQESQ
ncbi:MAG: cytochrome c oxidase subunit II [Acidobacteria bacterium]|nr:cytochrome c oxidase subunit II [Acidobacteriota bacterium]